CDIYHTLELTKGERLPAYTQPIVVVDGTTFYYKYSEPMRLYVKWQGKEVDGKIPDGKFETEERNGCIRLLICTCDNRIFFCSNGNVNVYILIVYCRRYTLFNDN
ncbi:hypothetical protein PMAYCL1PPCAC_09386, partial [Pristionchus mayeri]